jgi:hypothetical protein
MTPKKNPTTPKKGMTDRVHNLDTAEVVTYTGTKKEKRKKRRQYEGVGANLRRFDDKFKAFKKRRRGSQTKD